MKFTVAVLLGATLAAAAPQPQFGSLFGAAPSVTIKNGTVIGKTSNGVDSFLGIPYAQPPTGTLRLKRPATITKGFGTITATATPQACPQMLSSSSSSSNPLSNLTGLVPSLTQNPFTNPSPGPQAEDCLTLNVQRPSNASPSKLLPVLFWIYGGGFEFGSTSMYDGSDIVRESVKNKGDFIYVAVNYRVGGWGFLAGKELQAEGNTNLGLRDQRLGLQWVQENIAAFGGDPSKVTIWGESAGSISVFDHLLINNGDNTYNGKALFRGAIMDSGTAVPTGPVNAAKPQAVYNAVVAAAGCSTAANTVACLRALPYQQFADAANSVPGIFSYQSLDLSYLPRYDPTDNFFPRSPEMATKNNTFAKVPLIVGDQEDEGTLFSFQLNNVTDSDKLTTYLQSYFPDATRAQVAGLVAQYPTDPAAGSPFGSGQLNEIYPGFKRNAALLGDITFTITRRVSLALLKERAPQIPAWSYLGSYFSGTPFLGTFHATDILEIYFQIPYPNVRSSILKYYTAFVNNLDPNSYGADLYNPVWPQWQAANPQLLNFKQFNNAIIPDNFRSNVYDYLRANSDVLHV